MTIMFEHHDDDDDDCIIIEPPSSEKLETAEYQVNKTSAPESKKITKGLRNVRTHSGDPPPMNYVSLIGNDTLDRIENNINNASHPRITTKDFARMPDEKAIDIRNSALHFLFSDAPSLGDLECDLALGEASRAEAQNDPRIHVNAQNSFAYQATTATDYQRNNGYKLQDQRVPILPNAYEFPNGMPHMQGQWTTVISNPTNLSRGTVYVPAPAQVPENIYPANNGWPNAHQQTQVYADTYKQPNNPAPAEYVQAMKNYQGVPMDIPPKFPRRQLPAKKPGRRSSHHHCNPRQPPPSSMCATSMMYGQRSASKNPHHHVPLPHPQTVPWNGYGQAYATNSIPINPPFTHRDYRDTVALLAKIQQAHVQQNSSRTESVTNETTHLNASWNNGRTMTATNKRTYNEISTNNTQIAINANSEIPSTSNYSMGNVTVQIRNKDASRTDKTIAKKRVAKPNPNTLTTEASIPVNQVHVTSTETQPRKNNAEISNIDSSACKELSMNEVLNVIPMLPNTESPASDTNKSANITTTQLSQATIVSHYIADELQAPISKEGNVEPIINPNDDKARTELLEVQKFTTNINTNGEPAFISMNRDDTEIPLLMDQPAHVSMDTSKAHVSTTMEESRQLAVREANIGEIQYGEPPNKNINRQNGLTLIKENNDKVYADATTSPNTLVQVSMTSTRTEKISRNIETNEVRCNTVNTETASTQQAEKTNTIMNRVDHITETRVTTVEVDNQISNISIEHLKDILNNAKQNAIEATIDNQSDDNKVGKRDGTINCDDTTKRIAQTIENNNDVRINHGPQEIVNKPDDKLKMARKNLARLRAIEHENENVSYKKGETFVRKYTQTENQYQIKIAIGLNGTYVPQVLSISNDESSVGQDFQVDCLTSNTKLRSNNNANIIHSQRRQQKEILERSFENNQEINEAGNFREKSNTQDDGTIDEIIFSKFQIKFFRLAQERLEKNNLFALAEELNRDILHLIHKKDDESADMKYKCHVCHNKAIYSPRSFYYNRPENSLDTIQNCRTCITFRKKYIDVLYRYIQLEIPRERENMETNININHRNEANMNSTNVRQSDQSKTSVYIQKENRVIEEPREKAYLEPNSSAVRREEATINSTDAHPHQNINSENENQLSIITNSVLSSPIKAEIGDQPQSKGKHVLDVSNTQDCTKNDFMVKLRREWLKPSTWKALLCKTNKMHKLNTPNIATDNNRDNSSENRKKRTAKRKRILSYSTNSIVAEKGLGVGKVIDAAIHSMYNIFNNDKDEEKQGRNSKEVNCEVSKSIYCNISTNAEVKVSAVALKNKNRTNHAISKEANNKTESFVEPPPTSPMEKEDERAISLSDKISADVLITNNSIKNSNATSTGSIKLSNAKDDAGKDDASQRNEERENNKGRLYNYTRKVAKKAPNDNPENKEPTVKKARSDSFGAIKENCNSRKDLTEVKISGKKKNKKHLSKSKKHQPFEEINYKYICKVCTVGFKFLPACLNHMNRNHDIENPVVPLDCIRMRCAFCPLYVMPDMYNSHVRSAHDDKFSQKVEN